MSDIDEIKKQPFHFIAKKRIPSLERDGAEYKGLCPFHKEDSPSFTIRKNDSGIYLWKCFGCGANGNVVQFVQRFDDLSFSTALKKVKKEMEWSEGKETVESAFSAPLQSKKKHNTFPLSNMIPLTRAMLESPEANEWLANRGIGLGTASALHWGYTQTVKAISPNHPWVDDGWIVMPTYRDQTVVMAKYRSIQGKKTSDGKSGILRMKDTITCLYNLDAISSLEDAFLVEGEPDCAVMKQAGYCAASMPSADYNIPPEERDVLMQANRLFLAGDMDEVGRKAMGKLWAELRDGVYLIEWPDGCKDANDVLVKHCHGNGLHFQTVIDGLKAKALEKPIPDFYDVRQTLRNTNFTTPADNPSRLHAQDPNVDAMAITLPGNVVSIFATYPGTGKTTWVLDQLELPAVLHHKQVVLNYSAELSPEEFGRLVSANVLSKNRLEITKDDSIKAAEIFDKKNAKFYVGYNPDVTDPDKVLDIIEWAVRRLGAHIVVLDHLHFYCRGDKDIQQQARAMQRAKNLARKYNLIFIMVGQSRKAQPNRRNRPSELEDAKGSETFISDATTTYHLHRPGRRDINWDDRQSWPDDLLDPITDIRLVKCRTKGPGKAIARQRFLGEIGSFVPYDAAQEVQQ